MLASRIFYIKIFQYATLEILFLSQCILACILNLKVNSMVKFFSMFLLNAMCTLLLDTFLFHFKYKFYLNSEILIHYLCFCALCISLNLQQIKDRYSPPFSAKAFRKCTRSERGGRHLQWTASLCIFAVPALWNSSSTAHQNIGGPGVGTQEHFEFSKHQECYF